MRSTLNRERYSTARIVHRSVDQAPGTHPTCHYVVSHRNASDSVLGGLSPSCSACFTHSQITVQFRPQGLRSGGVKTGISQMVCLLIRLSPPSSPPPPSPIEAFSMLLGSLSCSLSPSLSLSLSLSLRVVQAYLHRVVL